MLGNKVHKRKCKHNFFHLISKTGYSFPVCCSSLPLKVMEKRLKLPVSIPQTRGSCLEKQEISTQRAARAGTGGWEKEGLHTWGTYSSYISVKSIGDCLSQLSGCLRDPGLPISILFCHIYIGSGSAQCVTPGMSRWNPPLPIVQLQKLKSTQSSLI